jgi:hypothetical protein
MKNLLIRNIVAPVLLTIWIISDAFLLKNKQDFMIAIISFVVNVFLFSFTWISWKELLEELNTSKRKVNFKSIGIFVIVTVSLFMFEFMTRVFGDSQAEDSTTALLMLFQTIAIIFCIILSVIISVKIGNSIGELVRVEEIKALNFMSPMLQYIFPASVLLLSCSIMFDNLILGYIALGLQIIPYLGILAFSLKFMKMNQQNVTPNPNLN